jgi:hypothetical protein
MNGGHEEEDFVPGGRATAYRRTEWPPWVTPCHRQRKASVTRSAWKGERLIGAGVDCRRRAAYGWPARGPPTSPLPGAGDGTSEPSVKCSFVKGEEAVLGLVGSGFMLILLCLSCPV